MSRGAKIFGLVCFFGFALPYFAAVAYLTAVQDPTFICGFKTFFGDRNCIGSLR